MFPGRYSPPCCWDVFVGSWPDSSPRTRSTFKHKMLTTCEGPTCFLSCSLPPVVRLSGQLWEASVKFAKYTKWGHPRCFPCCWPFYVIKNLVISHSEKWYSLFAVLFLCVTQTRQVQHTAVICHRGGCQCEHWRFQWFWSSRGQMSGDQLHLGGSRRSSYLYSITWSITHPTVCSSIRKIKTKCKTICHR